MLVIPQDVITDILSLLPVKPLFRFRCVRKSWCDLIDSAEFAKLHLKKTKEFNSHRRLIQQEISSLYTADFDAMVATNIADFVLAPFDGVNIIGCCNGLVSMQTSGKEIFIWNPSTRIYQKLPKLEFVWPPTANFQGSEMYVICGFGYDVDSDDYKLVFSLQCEPCSEVPFYSQVNVYSLKLNSWRKTKDFPYYLKCKGHPGVLASGAVHWVVGKSKSCQNQLVAAFDLAKEEYRIVQQPSLASKDQFDLNLESLRGCLSLMRLCKDYADIWVMEEYGNPGSWTKIAKIEASSFKGNSFDSVRTVEYSVIGKELVLEKDLHALLRYDMEKKLAKHVGIRGQEKRDYIYSLVYQESLVQLKNDGSRVPKRDVLQNSKKIKKPKKRDGFLSKGFNLVL